MLPLHQPGKPVAVLSRRVELRRATFGASPPESAGESVVSLEGVEPSRAWFVAKPPAPPAETGASHGGLEPPLLH